jgi:hypothetical protein
MVDRALDIHVGAEKQVATSARDSGQRRGRRVRTGGGVDKRAALLAAILVTRERACLTSLHSLRSCL